MFFKPSYTTYWHIYFFLFIEEFIGLLTELELIHVFVAEVDGSYELMLKDPYLSNKIAKERTLLLKYFRLFIAFTFARNIF